jgi:hypothetical protein
MGPGSGSEVLVLVPRGTILTVLGRDKEWIQVRLTPELRKTGMVMRWYKNEDRGWMHDSTVEVLVMKRVSSSQLPVRSLVASSKFKVQS